MSNAAPVVSGLIVAGYAVIGLFFLRFWKQANDRLFGFFALAFGLLALQRLLLTLSTHGETATTLLYGLRAFAFLVILFAVIDKNRKD